MVGIHCTYDMKIVENIIDSLFPPRASELMVRKTTTEILRNCYRPTKVPGCLCLATYQNPIIKSLITENKFHSNKRAAKLLSVLITEWAEAQSAKIVFIPVPLGKKRERERGYNQVYAVLKYLKSNPAATVKLNLCLRIKETSAQHSLPKSKRLVNVADAFKANHNELQKLRDVTLVVVDDVYTTGATMSAVRAALAPQVHFSCKIICVALAHWNKIWSQRRYFVVAEDEGFGHSHGYFVSLRHKLPHSIDLHSSRSSADACGLRRDFGSNPSSSRKIQQNQSIRFGFGICGRWGIRTLGTFYSPTV